MSKVELLQSPIVTNGTYTLDGDIGDYRNVDITFGEGDTSHVLTDEVSVKINNPSAYYLPANIITTSVEGNAHPDNIAIAQDDHYWVANLTGDDVIGEYVSISLSDIDTSTIVQLMFKLYYHAPYLGTEIEAQGIAHDGSATVLGSNIGYHAVHYPIDLMDYDLSQFAEIRLYCKGFPTGGLYFSFSNVHFIRGVANYVSNTGYNTIALSISDNQIHATGVLDIPVTSIKGTDPKIPSAPKVYNLYRKGSDGTPTLIMKEPESVGSSLGTASLVADLESLASKDYVTTTIDTLERSTLGGRVDTELDLPTTDVREGTIYLVGTLGSENYEEYIYTQDGEWDRLGTIRQSDVDLSNYTSTESMQTALDTSSNNMNTNIDTMASDIQTALENVDSDITNDLQNLKADTMMIESKTDVALWPDTLGEDKFLFVVEPEFELLDFKDAMWDTDLVTSNLGAYTQVPLLTSDTSDPNIEVLHARTYYTNSAYRPWVAYSAMVNTGWHSLDPVAGAYIGIHKKDSPFRFNQLTLQFAIGRQIFAGHEVLIQGSNDGITWDTILDTIPQEAMTHKYGAVGTTSRGSNVRWIASLDKYYEYSYVRMVCNVSATSFLVVNLFLIQDTAIHGTVKKYLD